jgi:hypothetical protein
VVSSVDGEFRDERNRTRHDDEEFCDLCGLGRWMDNWAIVLWASAFGFKQIDNRSLFLSFFFFLVIGVYNLPPSPEDSKTRNYGIRIFIELHQKFRRSFIYSDHLRIREQLPFHFEDHSYAASM